MKLIGQDKKQMIDLDTNQPVQQQTGGGQTYQGIRATSGYTPSQGVNDARNAMNQVNANRPGAYQSNFQTQLNDLYGKIMNRGKFKYDLRGDALYNQYKDQYVAGGKLAMKDTVGQSAALTGGYGSSYGTVAGSQAYQGYLQKLNELVPELEGRAYDRWRDQGTDLQNQYSLTMNADNIDYGRYQDALNQWNADRQAAQNAYQLAYSQDYAAYQDAAAQQAAAGQQAHQMALAMLQQGAMPTADMLALAGISEADAQAYLNALHPTGGRGGSGSGNNNGKNGTGTGSGLNGLTFEELNLLHYAPLAWGMIGEENQQQVMNRRAQDAANQVAGIRPSQVSGAMSPDKYSAMIRENVRKKK